MNRYIVSLVAALALAPVQLAGQQSPEARIEAARRQAASAGVPAGLLDNYVAQGRAKGVPMDRIAAAVERRAGLLTQARSALRSAPELTAMDLKAGADALEAGIDAESLRQVIQSARAEDRPVAIAVLTYLHGEGIPVKNALAQVQDAVRRGPEALRTLPAEAKARRGPPQGVGGRPAHAGQGRGGPPEGVPGRGAKPGSGKPDGVGKGRPAGKGPPSGKGPPGKGGKP